MNSQKSSYNFVRPTHWAFITFHSPDHVYSSCAWLSYWLPVNERLNELCVYESSPCIELSVGAAFTVSRRILLYHVTAREFLPSCRECSMRAAVCNVVMKAFSVCFFSLCCCIFYRRRNCGIFWPLQQVNDVGNLFLSIISSLLPSLKQAGTHWALNNTLCPFICSKLNNLSDYYYFFVMMLIILTEANM